MLSLTERLGTSLICLSCQNKHAIIFCFNKKVCALAAAWNTHKLSLFFDQQNPHNGMPGAIWSETFPILDGDARSMARMVCSPL